MSILYLIGSYFQKITPSDRVVLLFDGDVGIRLFFVAEEYMLFQNN